MIKSNSFFISYDSTPLLFSEKKESLAKSQQTRWKNIETNLLVKIEKLELQKILLGTPSFVAAGLISLSKI